MSDTDPNSGPGWNDHDTPYGTIHSYDAPGSLGTGGNAGSHTNIGPTTRLSIPSTKTYDGIYMTMCANNLMAHEGFVNAIYADSKGNPTVGIGHLLANIDAALGMRFLKTYHQSLGHGDSSNIEVAATSTDVRNGYNQVLNHLGSRAAVHLSNDDAIQACIADVQETEKGLRGLYANYDHFTDNAKTGLVDMGFNLGIPRLRNEFPKFNAAVNRGDWGTAATESHRTGIGDKRNADTAHNFQQALAGH